MVVNTKLISNREDQASKMTITQFEGDIGVYGIAVLRFFMWYFGN